MSAMDQQIAWLGWTGLHLTPWKLIGLTGAALFGARWLVQFLASRRAGRPVIPRVFWYMSLCGSVMALSYFLFSSKQDAVGVLQNLLPAFTAGYSLYLDVRHQPRRPPGRTILPNHQSRKSNGLLPPSAALDAARLPLYRRLRRPAACSAVAFRGVLRELPRRPYMARCGVPLARLYASLSALLLGKPRAGFE